MEKDLSLQQQVLMITGYSGAGKNTVLHALEDIGFYCVDNLPITMLDSLFHLTAQSQLPGQRIALGLDVRGVRNVDFFVQQVESIRATWPNTLKIIFLTCGHDVLVKRFQETRRKHPLANDVDLSTAITQEQMMLQPLIDIADVLLDTNQWNIHELRHYIRTAFSQDIGCTIMVNVISFGFKYGVPPESNFVFDVRSLPNPYFVQELKSLNGTDQKIIDHLFSNQEVIEYWQRFIDFVTYSIKKSYQEGRFFMNLAIGCTGGRHRSVAFVNRLVQEQLPNVTFTIKHRDIERDSST
ncbi:MAG: RNase adapter RapZ [bacterium]|nr:RNase adapter RapZ [bacterium]